MSASSQSGAPVVTESVRYSKLTPRERLVIQLIADGMNCRAIASELELSTKTIEVHKYNLMRKLDLHSTAQIVIYAFKSGIAKSLSPVERTKPTEDGGPDEAKPC
jgi:DNA-binding NarL/FixJ family response regulator